MIMVEMSENIINNPKFIVSIIFNRNDVKKSEKINMIQRPFSIAIIRDELDMPQW